ncbi:hypothetical protein WBG78_20130 [Chryseolinea sp. T2]|uniref:beta strand repeat-containing protein n=1 Tax=Chryseolinea sp. T2 TaxID=3129255 RepID=UPI003076E154
MKRIFATISLLVCLSTAFAQDKKSVVIGSLIDRPNALLVISPPGGNQGFLLPQLSSSQRLSISPASPVDDGLMVFDLTEKSFYYWNNSAWVKGLGEAGSQSLVYDAATQRLTISGSNNVDLSTLKEVPVQTGQAGKYLTTNGTTLSWANIASLGDITGITTSAGSGLTGGNTSGDINLAVNTDGTTVSVNGGNQLQVSDGGISTNKLANNSVTSAKIVDGTVTGADLAANSVTSANILDGTVSNTDLAVNSVNSSTIVDASVTGADLATNSVTTTNILDGTISSVDLAPNSVTSSHIVDGTIANADLGLNSVTTNNIADGTVTAADIADGTITSVDILDGTINSIDIADGSITSAKILDATIGNADIANNAITSNQIQDGTVVTADLASGGASTVLTTNSSGVVSWVPQSTFGDSQTLSLTGNSLSISNGNAVTLTTAGEVSGPIDAMTITPGGANQVLMTNLTATDALWVTPGGDVTGSPANSTVWRIRNNPVASTAPAVGDALVWDGTAWTPTSVAGGSPTTQFYSLDPSSFQGMQPDGNKDASLGLMETTNGQYAFAFEDSRTIVAPVNLPHGAVIQNITVYYEITNIIGVLTPINVRMIQKNLGGGLNIDVGVVVIAPLLSVGVTQQSQSFSHTVDNSTSSYRLLIKFSHLIDADEASEATQRIYGVRIQYLK